MRESVDWRRVVLCEFKNKDTGTLRYGDMDLNKDYEYQDFKRRINSGSITRYLYIGDLFK